MEWFVPSRTVLKNERLAEAVQRVAKPELGCNVEIVERLGTYEHVYKTSEVADVNRQHYVANVFIVNPIGGVEETDDQLA